MIQKKIAVVYFAPTANRRFLTLHAACNREAAAIISKRYPTVEFDRETGDGFCWREIKRSEVLHRRLANKIKLKFRG
jgi:hypothetical protein